MLANTSSAPSKNCLGYMWGDKKMLLVDSDLTGILLIKELLSKTGIKIISAQKGNQAIETLKKTRDINVVLLELYLPDKSGFETFKALKGIQPGLPIIANTATVYREIRFKCKKLGFYNFIEKPANIDRYFKIINNALNLQ